MDILEVRYEFLHAFDVLPLNGFNGGNEVVAIFLDVGKAKGHLTRGVIRDDNVGARPDAELLCGIAGRETQLNIFKLQ